MNNNLISTNITNETNVTNKNINYKQHDLNGFIFTISVSVIFMIIIIFSCIGECIQNKKCCKSQCCIKKYYEKRLLDNIYNSKQLEDNIKIYDSMPPHIGIIKAEYATEDI